MPQNVKAFFISFTEKQEKKNKNKIKIKCASIKIFDSFQVKQTEVFDMQSEAVLFINSYFLYLETSWLTDVVLSFT